jgi:hypothetical protein
MISIGTRKLEIVTFYENPRNLERSIQKIVGNVRGTMKVLAVCDGVPTPAKYLAVIQNISTLKEMWSRHIEIERALFPKVPGFDRYSDNEPFRIIEENVAIEKQLASVLGAPWPRSPQAGLLALRIRASEVLHRLLTQIELEGIQFRDSPFRGRRPAGLALAAARDSRESAS